MSVKYILVILLCLSLILVSVPLIAEENEEAPPLTLIVYPDGFIEVVVEGQSAVGEDVEMNITSLYVDGGYTERGGDTIGAFQVRVELSDELNSKISEAITRADFDLTIESKNVGSGYLYLQLNPEEVDFPELEIKGEELLFNFSFEELLTSLEARIKVITYGSTTPETLSTNIQLTESMFEGQIESALEELGLTLQEFNIEVNSLGLNRAEILVAVVIEGNFTEAFRPSTYQSFLPTKFSPEAILSIFFSAPPESGRIIFTYLSSTGRVEGNGEITYKGDIDTTINANKGTVLSRLREMAEVTPIGGEDWLPLINILEDCDLSVKDASIHIEYPVDGKIEWNIHAFKIRPPREGSETSFTYTNFFNTLSPLEYTFNLVLKGGSSDDQRVEIDPKETDPTYISPDKLLVRWTDVPITILAGVEFHVVQGPSGGIGGTGGGISSMLPIILIIVVAAVVILVIVIWLYHRKKSQSLQPQPPQYVPPPPPA